MELSNFPTFPLFLLFVRREQLDSLGSVLTSKTPSYIKYSRVFYLLQERNLPFFRELANLLFFLLDKLLALISSLGATLNLPSLPPLPRHPRPDSRLLFLPFILSFRFRLHVLALVPRLLATPLNLLPQQSPSLPHNLHARTFERVQLVLLVSTQVCIPIVFYSNQSNLSSWFLLRLIFSETPLLLPCIKVSSSARSTSVSSARDLSPRQA
jgi:hypothetical protein